MPQLHNYVSNCNYASKYVSWCTYTLGSRWFIESPTVPPHTHAHAHIRTTKNAQYNYILRDWNVDSLYPTLSL